jgi:peroxiredoxin
MQRRDFVQAAVLSSLLMSASLVSAQSQAGKSKFNLKGTDAYGKKLDLNDFSGKTVLVSFFTIDCELCTHDLKLMREFYVGNAKKNFALLGINIDQHKKDVDDYNEITTLAYPKNQRFPTVWRNAPGHADNFGNIITRPTHFVLDVKHQLVFKREGAFQPEDWDNLWLSLE